MNGVSGLINGERPNFLANLAYLNQSGTFRESASLLRVQTHRAILRCREQKDTVSGFSAASDLRVHPCRASTFNQDSCLPPPRRSGRSSQDSIAAVCSLDSFPKNVGKIVENGETMM